MSQSNKYLMQDGDVLLHEKTLMRIYLHREDYRRCNINDVSSYPYMIPVGSVEFVTEYATAHRITIPENISYPQPVMKYLYRDVWITTLGDALDYQFVKPIKTKEFTGAIKSSLSGINPSTVVWASKPVNFMFEYRFYIVNGRVVGYGRYDDLIVEDHLALDDKLNLVNSIINDFKEAPAGYAIDIGYDGHQWMLVEINDGWALGLYKGMPIRDYVQLITERWNQIRYSL